MNSKTLLAKSFISVRGLIIIALTASGLSVSLSSTAVAASGKGLVCVGFVKGLGKNNPKQNWEDNYLYLTHAIFFENNSTYSDWQFIKQGDKFDAFEMSSRRYHTDDRYIYLSTDKRFFIRNNVIEVIDRSTLNHLSVPLTKDGMRFLTLDEMTRLDKDFIHPIECKLSNSKKEFRKELNLIVESLNTNFQEKLKDKKI